MPTLENTCLYAMYVIGKFESGHNWTAANLNDPITIGMMQWYGTRAAALLNRIQAEQPGAYALLSQRVRDKVASTPADSQAWTDFYLTRDDANTIVQVFTPIETHEIQQNQAVSDFTAYAANLTANYGYSEAHPQELVYGMLIYHQSPRGFRDVSRSAGGNASLETLRATVLNDTILKQYKTRYNGGYDMLKAWDGESPPPNFGQVTGEDDTEGGDPGTPNGNTEAPGASGNGVSKLAAAIRYILAVGDTLVVYGDSPYSNGVIFHQASMGRFVHGSNPNGTSIPGNTTDPEPPSPPPPGTPVAQAVVDLYKSWSNLFVYSQGGNRLTPFNVTPPATDCSGSINTAFQMVAGINPGTYTDDMVARAKAQGKLVWEGPGSAIPVASLALGDIIATGANSSFSGPSHVVLVTGADEVYSHGGPGPGPDPRTNIAAYVGAKPYAWVMRWF